MHVSLTHRLLACALLLPCLPVHGQAPPAPPSLEQLQRQQTLANQLDAEAKKNIALLQASGKTPGKDPVDPMRQLVAQQNVAEALGAVGLAMETMRNQHVNPSLKTPTAQTQEAERRAQADLLLLQKLMQDAATRTEMNLAAMKALADQLKNATANRH